MKRTLTVIGIVMAFAMLTVSARSSQQNGFYNAQSSFPTAPQQVLLKIDFATSSSSVDQFFMAVIMTRADVLAQSYYGVYSKADAIILRDTLNRVLPPPPVTVPCPPSMTPPVVGASMSLAPSTEARRLSVAGPAFTKPSQIPKRPKGVPKGAEYLGISGDAHHWRTFDKKGVANIFTSPVKPDVNATPKK